MITGRTDRQTDGQTDRQTDRVRRNMPPPPREEGRIINVARFLRHSVYVTIIERKDCIVPKVTKFSRYDVLEALWS